ncbi:phosphodiester glycosidase family protein [Nocardiopsis ansamitocini]|uniref:Phosphodiester glycosidase domain-containing protein n=1 Tax=Nocardiopsis ansamitocini TaxID=1670832 RepID=A0A9W6P362_9ACTN|nr:phosphodiester glycosidase family protein [Nocardiopsis ansamitocini]GLU46178.1 hypothetical protein Nans01_05290 [Nocardiopsis ansamitocini]
MPTRFAVALLVPVLVAGLCGAGRSPVAEQRSHPVAPGVVLTVVDSAGIGSAQRFTELGVELSGDVRVGYLDSGVVAHAEPVAQRARAAGAVAAVNGDFFDLGGSSAPLGGAVRDATVVKSPATHWRSAAVFDADGTGRIAELDFTGTIGLPGGNVALDRLNSHEVPENGIGAFTELWGDSPRARAVRDAGRVYEVTVTQGRVAEANQHAGNAPIPAGTTVLLGREAGADRLARLRTGDPVTVEWDIRAGGGVVHTAIGGRHVLVREGRIADVDATVRHPRTAVGFSADGRQMWWITADGRRPGTRGATLREMGERLLESGAWSGLELDGGGSATLAARTPGGPIRVENRTGEGERAVPNSLAVYAPQGSGTARGLWVRPAVEQRPAPGSALPEQADPHRVFTGLTRRLAADPYDEGFGPAGPSGHPVVWAADSGTVADGVLRAGAPGRVTVGADMGRARGGLQLEVLKGPERLEPSREEIGLADAASSVVLVLSGVAPDGTRAPIETDDITVDHDPELVRVTPEEAGVLRVTAVAGNGSGAIRLSTGPASVRIPVSIGSVDRVLADFEDAADWTARAARGQARTEPTAGRTGLGLALSYDFSGSDATRAAYAHPPAPLRVGSTASMLRLWVSGDGQGARLAVTVSDEDGQQRTLYGPRVTWSGWQQAEIPIPAALSQPVAVERLYLVETSATASYTGRITVDELTAAVVAHE